MFKKIGNPSSHNIINEIIKNKGNNKNKINKAMNRINIIYKSFKKFLNNKISLFILVSPYLLFTIIEYKFNYLFNWKYFILLIISILLVDLKFNYNSKVIMGVIFYLLYIEIITNSLSIKHNIFIYFLIFILILFLFIKIPIIIIHTFLIFFSFNITYKSKKVNYKIKTESKIRNNQRIQNFSPILIILLDEYSSPREVKIQNSLLEYSIKNNFEVIDPIKTKETQTINSISSMLNYDISNNIYFRENLSEIERFELINNSQFEKDLIKIGVKLNLKNYYRTDGINYPVPNYFMCPRNFIELILYKSIIPRIERNLLGDYTFEIYNKIILKDLQRNLKNNLFKKNNIYFYHLAMPHYPFSYFSEYLKDNNYKKYYSFVNSKITNLLKENLNSNKIKIIILGDHGFRNDKSINPYNTFLVFKNFDKNQIKMMNTIQDLPNFLINDYIKVCKKNKNWFLTSLKKNLQF